MSRPLVAALEGLVVLDFTRLLPGPFCTQLLANLGADVIKIEDPALGDYMRSVPPLVDGTSYPFLMVNRGKRSLAVDLKTSEGQDILRQLSGRADVVVEQFRPGVMARLGLVRRPGDDESPDRLLLLLRIRPDRPVQGPPRPRPEFRGPRGHPGRDAEGLGPPTCDPGGADRRPRGSVQRRTGDPRGASDERPHRPR